MKDGYYLSPDGKVIVEIRYENFNYEGYVKGKTSRGYWLHPLRKPVAFRLFKNWTRLN